MTDDAPGTTALPTIFQGAFDAAVLIMIDDEWVFIDAAEKAKACLLQRFPGREGASFDRALNAAEGCLSGTGNGAAARATFVVAAMEAGLPFEVIDDPVVAFERRTELEAQAGLQAILLEGGLLPDNHD